MLDKTQLVAFCDAMLGHNPVGVNVRMYGLSPTNDTRDHV